ncbi:unnamed protein product [Enterobius vermicularis]|uniref:MI domain-containing protein n=1 Tax=Enterobius vermicularis TaxID=51028 RepID=A0A0N4V0A3_ENTVE|nr:unnamed protein product [Enterobius vermicularis]
MEWVESVMEMGIGNNVLVTCKRKDARQKMKRLKKIQKAAFATGKKVESVIFESFAQKNSREKKKKRLKRKRKSFKELNGSSALKDGNSQKLELVRGIEDDEAELERLSKKLGYRRTRSQKLPRAFNAEGLDYLLEVCDNIKKSEAWYSSPKNEDSVEQGFSLVSESSSLLEEDCEGEFETDDEKEIEEHVRTESSGGEEFTEDIYGRTVAKKTGMVIVPTSNVQKKFREFREDNIVTDDEEREKLERTLRGLVNRLNENTIVGSVKTVKELFSSHSHNNVKSLLYLSLLNIVVVEYRLPDRILIELALFIALLHILVSADISSHFVESFVLEYLKRMQLLGEDKSLENMSLLLAELFNFKVIKSTVIGDVVDRLVGAGGYKALECAKLLLAYAGVLLKKRDCSALQACIVRVQSSLMEHAKEVVKDQHLQFIVEEFLNLKGANIRKWTESIDFSLLEHYMSLYRGLTKKVDREDELGMSVDDIEHVKERGRWWLIGSAWNEASHITSVPGAGNLTVKEPKFDKPLLDLAKKAKMNTSVRRDVFCTLMSSKNESDAFEKLMRLALKGQQEREIIHICIHCALQETKYNSFYSAVIEQFCLFHKRFKLTAQYALWDRIKNLSTFKEWQRSHLATLTVDMIVNKAVGLTVLKVVEFGTIDATATCYIRRVLESILLRCSNDALREIFEGVITSSRHKVFSEGLHILVCMISKDSDDEVILSRIGFLNSIWGDDRL